MHFLICLFNSFKRCFSPLAIFFFLHKAILSPHLLLRLLHLLQVSFLLLLLHFSSLLVSCIFIEIFSIQVAVGTDTVNIDLVVSHLLRIHVALGTDCVQLDVEGVLNLSLSCSRLCFASGRNLRLQLCLMLSSSFWYLSLERRCFFFTIFFVSLCADILLCNYSVLVLVCIIKNILFWCVDHECRHDASVVTAISGVFS